MSFMHTVGSFAGKSAAYAWEGSKLGATSFAQGAKEGYVSKAEELRAKRIALAGDKPAVVRQRKLSAESEVQTGLRMLRDELARQVADVRP